MEKVLVVNAIGVAGLGYVAVRLLDPFARASYENIGVVSLLIGGYLWARRRGWFQ